MEPGRTVCRAGGRRVGRASGGCVDAAAVRGSAHGGRAGGTGRGLRGLRPRGGRAHGGGAPDARGGDARLLRRAVRFGEGRLCARGRAVQRLHAPRRGVGGDSGGCGRLPGACARGVDARADRGSGPARTRGAVHPSRAECVRLAARGAGGGAGGRSGGGLAGGGACGGAHRGVRHAVRHAAGNGFGRAVRAVEVRARPLRAFGGGGAFVEREAGVRRGGAGCLRGVGGHEPRLRARAERHGRRHAGGGCGGPLPQGRRGVSRHARLPLRRGRASAVRLHFGRSARLRGGRMAHGGWRRLWWPRPTRWRRRRS